MSTEIIENGNGQGDQENQENPASELDKKINELEQKLEALTDEKGRQKRIAELEAEINRLENPEEPKPPKPEGGTPQTYRFDQMPVGYGAAKETAQRLWDQMTADIPDTAFVRSRRRDFIEGVVKETMQRRNYKGNETNYKQSREFASAKDALTALNLMYNAELQMPVTD